MRRLLYITFVFSVIVSVFGINELAISPPQPVLSRPVGGNVLLTCQPNVEKDDLITDLLWWDPRGIPIDGNYPYRQRVTTEKLTKDSPALALIIQAFQQTDAGYYNCTGNYANNLRLSASVRLDSIFPIKWEDAPETQNPVIGRDYKVRCKVSANPSPYVDWSRDGEAIRPNGRYVIQADGLLIPKVNEGDDGVYTCRAIVVQTGELASRNIRVEVHTPPSFAEMSNVFELVEGTTQSIICNATGKPKPELQWIKDKTREDLGRKSRFTVTAATGLLVINPVQEEDDGEYKCVASNPAAKVERHFKIQVLVPPKIPLLKNITVDVGKEAVFECRAKGKPLPTISFKKFGGDTEYVEGNYIYDGRISVERIEDPETNEVVGKLKLNRVDRKDDGLYHCVAKNRAGALYKTGHIAVQFPPSFKNTPMTEAWSWQQRPVNLTCLAESIPNATIVWKIRETEIRVNTAFIELLQPGPYSILRIRPMDYSHYGPYKCVATNVLGQAEHSIWLKEATVPNVISQVSTDLVSATSIKFNIREPQDTGALNITSYVVQFTTDFENGWNNAAKHSWQLGSLYFVENLRPDTTYHFRFAAVNAVGQGAWASGGHYRTLPRTRPSPPELIVSGRIDGVALSPSDSSIEVRWKVSSETGGEPIRSHRIRYCVVTNSRDVNAYTDCDTIDLPVEQFRGLSYELRKLHSNTIYRIEISAENRIGRSDPNVALIRTAKGVDKDLLVSATNRGTFALSSAAIIAIVVASLLVVLLLIDVSCFALNNAGIMYLMCGRRNRKDDNRIASLYGWRFPLLYRSQKESSYSGGPPGLEVLPPPDADLVFEDKEPLRENGKARVTVVDDRLKKDTKQTFDDRSATYKTTFIGKNSEV